MTAPINIAHHDDYDETVRIELTREQAMHVANSLAWNVDLDTVRDDPDDGNARADAVTAFRDAVRDALDPR